MNKELKTPPSVTEIISKSLLLIVSMSQSSQVYHFHWLKTTLFASQQLPAYCKGSKSWFSASFLLYPVISEDVIYLNSRKTLITCEIQLLSLSVTSKLPPASMCAILSCPSRKYRELRRTFCSHCFVPFPHFTLPCLSPPSPCHHRRLLCFNDFPWLPIITFYD